MKFSLNQGKHKIDVSDLSSGTYLIKSELGVQKFIKE
jgi:hypothetical protein